MAGQGFAGQDPAITAGGFVEKVTAKFIALSKTKSERMANWIKNNSKEDGLSPAQQQQAADQGMQDAADDIALAIYESLKEMNGAIISNQANDPDFWAYMNGISIQFNALLAATKIFATALKADIYATAMATAYETALNAVDSLSPASQIKAHMEK